MQSIEVPEEAYRLASDRISTSPRRAVYEMADDLARVAVNAAAPALRKQGAERERERVRAFIARVEFEVGCMRDYADAKPGVLGKLAGEMAEPLEIALDVLNQEAPDA
jgi:hypothetical protein